MWIPTSSDFYKNSIWIEEQGLNEDLRPFTNIMIASKDETNGNLLTIETFKLLFKINEFVRNFTSTDGITFKKECLRSKPDPSSYYHLLSSPEQIKNILSKISSYPGICDLKKMFMSQIVTTCKNLTPLSLLNAKNDIDGLNKILETFSGNNNTQLLDQINEKEKMINKTNKMRSPIYPLFIGGVGRNSNGRIETAKAMLMKYLFKSEGDHNFMNGEKYDIFALGIIIL